MTTLNPRTVNTLRQLVEALYDAPREVQPGRTLLVVTDDLGAVLGDLPMLLLALNTAATAATNVKEGRCSER